MTDRQRVAIEWPRDVTVGASREGLRDRLAAHREAGYDVILDFSVCAFIDSSGLGVLYAAFTAAGDAGRRLIFCGLDADLTELLVLTKLDIVFWPVRDVAEARVRLLGTDPPPHLPPDGGPTLTLMP